MKSQRSKILFSAMAALMLFSAAAVPALAIDRYGRPDGSYRYDHYQGRGYGDMRSFRHRHGGMTPGEYRDMRWNNRHNDRRHHNHHHHH
jgi:hypothetical protein